MNLPGEMTVVEIAAPGGPEQLKPAVRPLPQPGDVKCWFACMPRASTGRTSCSARAAIPRRRAHRTCPAWKSREKSSHWDRKSQASRLGDKVTSLAARRRLRRLCGCGGAVADAHPEGLEHGGGGGDTGNVSHGVDQSVRARPLQIGRYRSHSWRHQRHWHDRDSACESVGCARLCDRGIGSRRRGPARPWAPFAASTIKPRILSK